MYFKKISLTNVGPIEKLDYEFQFHDRDNPKPLILVGTNGSGKSILLSYLLNPLLCAQQIVFDDTEVEKNQVYKIRNPQYITNGATFSYANITFGADFKCYECQLSHSREDYIKPSGDPEMDNSFEQIPLDETSIFNLLFAGNPVANNKAEVLKQFRSNCVLYFPANRFEQPAWLNQYNLKNKAEFIELPRLKRVSNRRIIQQSPLMGSKNWLLDILLDRAMYEMKISDILIPCQEEKNVQEKSLQVFNGYEGNSATIWNAITQLIKLILRTDDNVGFEIGNRQNRVISVVRNETEFVPNIFQLSTGQTSILNIVLSILRDFDMSGATFEKLEDITGVVIIDEVDAHLHADLQCNLLPAVIAIFPKIQFILTTHSPLFLLGMKKKFGENGFDVLSLPTAQKIDLEDFEEFQSAFEFYTDSNIFKQRIESEIKQSQKPVIFVEGDYDIKYLRKAATLLSKEALLDKIVLLDADGFGNLNKIWSTYTKDSKLAIAFPKTVGLIYDCDTEKKVEDYNRNHCMAKKRVIPSIAENPISKGIENLFSTSIINQLRTSHQSFFDITPEITKSVGGKEVKQREVCEINKDQKKNLCQWICQNGKAEDFSKFESVFALIEDIIGNSA